MIGWYDDMVHVLSLSFLCVRGMMLCCVVQYTVLLSCATVVLCVITYSILCFSTYHWYYSTGLQLIACPVDIVPSPFLRAVPPRVCEDVARVHLLPNMVVNGMKYPAEYRALPKEDILAESVGVGLIPYFKYVHRHQSTTTTAPTSWCRRMWKYAIHLVLTDIRACTAIGKWKNLLNCILHRKLYVTIYSNFLKVCDYAIRDFVSLAGCFPDVVLTFYEHRSIYFLQVVLCCIVCIYIKSTSVYCMLYTHKCNVCWINWMYRHVRTMEDIYGIVLRI